MAAPGRGRRRKGSRTRLQTPKGAGHMPRREAIETGTGLYCAAHARQKRRTEFLGMVDYGRIHMGKRRGPAPGSASIARRRREKITVADAQQIYALSMCGNRDSVRVAGAKGIAPKTVRDIWNGRTWRRATQGLCRSAHAAPLAGSSLPLAGAGALPPPSLCAGALPPPSAGAGALPPPSLGAGDGADQSPWGCCITRIDGDMPSYEEIGYELCLDIAGARGDRACILLDCCCDPMIEGAPTIEELCGEFPHPVQGDRRAHDEELLDGEAAGPDGIAENEHQAGPVEPLQGLELA